MATVAHEQQSERRRRRRAVGLLLPAVAVLCLLLTLVAALVLASRLGPAEPAAATAPAGPAAVIASSSARAKPVAGKPAANAASSSAAVKPALPRTGVSPSPDRLPAGSPERAAAEFATAWSAGGSAAGQLGGSDLSALAGVRLLGAEIGAPRATTPDRASVPLALSVESAGSIANAAVDASLARDATGAWRLDATALARDLGASGMSADSAAAPAVDPSSALAALGQAMRSSPASTAAAAEAPYPSGGLGLAEPHWEQHGRRDASGVRGWFGLQYRDGNISRIEKTMAAGSGLALDEARREARLLAPDDAVATGRTTAPEPIDLYTSATLAARFRSDPIKPGEPARFHVRYRLTNDRVVGYVVGVGVP